METMYKFSQICRQKLIRHCTPNKSSQLSKCRRHRSRCENRYVYLIAGYVDTKTLFHSGGLFTGVGKTKVILYMVSSLN